MGGHAVKLIGWGTTADGQDYWVLHWILEKNRLKTSYESGRNSIHVFIKSLSFCFCSFLQISGTEDGVMYVLHVLWFLLCIFELKCNFSFSFRFSCFQNLSNIKQWQDGYFKIRRGTNECKIEEDAVAGIPSSKNLMKAVTSPDSALDASM